MRSVKRSKGNQTNTAIQRTRLTDRENERKTATAIIPANRSTDVPSDVDLERRLLSTSHRQYTLVPRSPLSRPLGFRSASNSLIFQWLTIAMQCSSDIAHYSAQRSRTTTTRSFHEELNVRCVLTLRYVRRRLHN